MDTELLRDFVCVAQTLNYREASERLYISQSALSRRIHTLEEELGVLLFERNTRSVKMTAGGKACLAGAQKILNAADEMLTQIQLTTSGAHGSLNIGYCETGNNPYIASLMKEMKEHYPEIRIRVYEEDIGALRRDILNGTADALMLLQPTVSDLPGLAYQVMKPESPCILLPASHPLAGSKTIRIEQVKDENVFMFHREKSTQLYDKLLRVWTDTGLVPHLVPAQDQQISMLVAAGEGVLLCPSNEQNSIDTPSSTVRIPIAGNYSGFDRVLVWNEKNTNPSMQILRRVMEKISSRLNHCK